ncbi:MAG: ABC transporter substrate-binding protein [Micropruina sp.]|uniref:ABC transporter substrate-binding protein n=1 Tax=Micropruina sp. TaxID=2737536 RepID=UPI0039E69AB6
MSKIAASVDPASDLTASYLRAVGAAEGLMKIQPDGSVKPELAVSVTNDDPLTWTVKLDPKRTFWSGAPITADAVAASLNRMKDVSSLGATQVEGVTMQVVDDSTLRLKTKTPRPAMPYALAHYQLVVHNVKAYGNTTGSVDVKNADLTGPYRLTAFNTDRGMTLKANDTWWGGKPGYQSVEVKAVGDSDARAELALNGQADVIGDFPAERAKELGGSAAKLVATSAANTVAVYLNPKSPRTKALSDVRVRRALAVGVDRAGLVDLVASGLVKPAGSWLSTSPVFADAITAKHSYDPKAAARLLDEAGWALANGVRSKDGKPLTLRLLTFGAEKADGEVLQAQWGKLGVTVEVRHVENTAVAEAIKSGDWDMVIQAWTTLGDHAALIAGQIGPDGSANHAGIVPAKAAALLQRANSDPSPEQRRNAIIALDGLITQEVPLVPLHPRAVTSAVAQGVSGFVAHPLQYETLVTGALRPAQ